MLPRPLVTSCNPGDYSCSLPVDVRELCTQLFPPSLRRTSRRNAAHNCLCPFGALSDCLSLTSRSLCLAPSSPSVRAMDGNAHLSASPRVLRNCSESVGRQAGRSLARTLGGSVGGSGEPPESSQGRGVAPPAGSPVRRRARARPRPPSCPVAAASRMWKWGARCENRCEALI